MSGRLLCPRPELRVDGRLAHPWGSNPDRPHSPLHLREGLLQAAPRGPHDFSEGAEGLAQEILHTQGIEKTSVTHSAHSHPTSPITPCLEVGGL